MLLRRSWSNTSEDIIEVVTQSWSVFYYDKAFY